VTALLDFYPPLIAHRGLSQRAPENTMIAFMQAAACGFKWIECDVMLAQCGKPIIFHDETLERTTKAQGLVEAYPYAYLQTLDAGCWFDPRFSGEIIPSLPQMMSWLAHTNLKVNIELKPVLGNQEQLVQTVLKMITPSPRVLFSSFSFKILEILRHYAPDCLIGLVLDDWHPDWQAQTKALSCSSFHLNQTLINQERAAQIKASGLYLLAYTVNNFKRAQALYALGVDAVFTDSLQPF
jgi:glycerophosphoryl diester phosphodiesterase